MGTTVTQSNPLYNKLEIAKVGKTSIATASITFGGAGWDSDIQLVTIAHNLDYKPVVTGYLDQDGLRTPLNYSISNAGVSFMNFFTIHINIFTDTTNVYIYTYLIVNAASAGTTNVAAADVTYYLYSSTAA